MSTTYACVDRMNAYADYLTAHPRRADRGINWPEPLAWTEKVCSGVPTWNLPTTFAARPTISVSAPARSLYLPPMWAVSHTTPWSLDAVPMTRILTRLNFTDGTFTFTPPAPQDPARFPSAVNEWAYRMCTGRTQAYLGERVLMSWQPGSVECDDFMHTYCQSGVAFNDPQCACFSEQTALYQQFCVAAPGVTLPSVCDGHDPSPVRLPVKCFGMRCSLGGYLTRSMQDQPCTATLCQQVVQNIGSDNAVDVKSRLWCGSGYYDQIRASAAELPSVSASAAAAEAMLLSDNSMLYVLLGLAGVVVLVSVMMVFVAWRRSAQDDDSGEESRTATAT